MSRFRMSGVGRAAAGGAILLLLVVVGLVLFAGGSSYQVTATFQNASQIVSGDLVEVAGTKVGTVGSIHLDQNGLAAVTLDLDQSEFTPLHEGTTATIREVSLSGIANRYVSLQLGPGSRPEIPDRGSISTASTTSEVDLDQLFNTLDAPTRLGLQNLIQGTASQYANAGATARQAFQYLNPAIASSSMLFAELNHNSASFTNFLTRSGHLLADIGSRQTALSDAIANLSEVTAALGTNAASLSRAVGDLPRFQTQADTTFTAVRRSLGYLTPLIDATRPVAPKVQRVLAQLEPLAIDAVPTFRSLATAITRPGADNDLIDLTRLGVPLARAAVDRVFADGKLRRGALPISTLALNEATPETAFARPYAVDLTGWFEGFSHPGGYDANGAFSRVALDVGVGTISNGVLNLLQPLVDATQRNGFAFGSNGLVTTDQGDRCPGSMERGATYVPESGYACTPSQQPTGN